MISCHQYSPYLLLLAVFLAGYTRGHGQGGELLTIRFDSGYSLAEGEREGERSDAYTYLVPVKLSEDSIAYGDIKHRVRYPAGMDPDSVAIADEYLFGSAVNPEAVLMSLLIYPYQSATPDIYVDPTGTFTFTEANVFPISPADASWVVAYPNRDNGDCKFPVDYRMASFADKATKQEIASSFQSSGQLNQSNKNVDPDHWLESRRMNFRFGNFVYDSVTYRIGLCDYIGNGNYTDEEDRILFAKGQEPLDAGLEKDGYAYHPGMLLDGDGQAFQVVGVEECGNRIDLLPVTGSADRSGLVIGGMLQELDSAVTITRTLDLTAFRTEKEYFLLDFWGSWCRPCIDAFPKLREFRTTYQDRVDLIGINVGDTEATFAEWESRLAIDWPSYRITAAQLKPLNVSGFPTYLLFSQAGQLLASSRDLDEIVELMESEK